MYVPLVPLAGSQAQYQLSSRSPTVQTPTPATPSPEADVVQFASPTFFAQEDDKRATVQVLRFGTLSGSCSVRYTTQDATAKAGQKYKATEGQVDFGPGEHTRRFEILIIDDDAFDTTIEFEVHLSKPKNCILIPEGALCRVMIIDDDLFPSNDFKEAIATGEDAELHKVGFSLLYAFMKFSFLHVPSIAWKSVVMVLTAQFGNLYYLMTIFLKVYLVDVCLNVKDESTEDRLFIKGNRAATAMFLGAVWILPNFLLTASDYFEMAVLEMGFNLRKHLRVNLFRKYLNYTEESRKEVPVQDLKTSMMEDIPDLVSDGYLIMFELLRIFGKIACVAYFMLKKHPRSAVPLFVYPLLMISFLGMRYSRRLKLLSEQGDGESATMAWLLHADSAHQLITDYKQRSFVVSKFEEVLNNQRKLTMNLKRFAFLNELLIPWITILAVGLYMGIWAKQVVDGDISLGSYLATINVYKDLGDRFAGVYTCFQSMSEVIDPLSGITVQLNLDTDVTMRKQFNATRDEYMQDFLAKKAVPPGHLSAYDAIPISFQAVTMDYSPSLRNPLTIDTPQGVCVMVRGPHDSGKSTILSLLTDKASAHPGSVQCPLHLRVLNVSYSPVIVQSIGLLKNLTFGFTEEFDIDYDRVRRILVRVGLDKPWFLEELDKDLRGGASPRGGVAQKSGGDEEIGLLPINKDDGSDSDESSDKDSNKEREEEEEVSEEWIRHLSNSEKKRFNLARALIYNPEVMVIHRPVDELDLNLSEKVLGLMREYVDCKGVEVDTQTGHRRRPRTLFYTQGLTRTTSIADIVWQVGQGEGVVVEPGPYRKGL